MRNKKDSKSINRRGFLPLVGVSLFIPFFSQSKPVKNVSPKENDEFATLLTPNGGVVKVKRSTLKKAKVLKKNISNRSLLNWLKPKKGHKS